MRPIALGRPREVPQARGRQAPIPSRAVLRGERHEPPAVVGPRRQAAGLQVHQREQGVHLGRPVVAGFAASIAARRIASSTRSARVRLSPS